MSRSYASSTRTVGLNGRIHLTSYIRMLSGIKKGDEVNIYYDEKTGWVIIKPVKKSE